MIIFLYGPDSYRLNLEADSIVDKYRKKHPSGFNLFSFDLDKDSPRKVEDAIKTMSFFDEVKLVILKNTFNHSPDLITEIIGEHDLVNDKRIVVLIKESAGEKDLKSKNSQLLALLTKSKNLVRNFEVLNGKKLEDWVRKEFSLRSCAITSVLARKLIESIGKDMTRLVPEINKLSNFKVRGDIGSSDIDMLVHQDIEPNIFHLLDAIAAKDRAKALELLYREIKSGRDPHYLLTMVAYQLRSMLSIKDLMSRGLSNQDISKKSGLHPFVVKKNLSLLSKSSIEDIKNRFNYLAQGDLLFKQGRVDIEEYLYGFVLTPSF